MVHRRASVMRFFAGRIMDKPGSRAGPSDVGTHDPLHIVLGRAYGSPARIRKGTCSAEKSFSTRLFHRRRQDTLTGCTTLLTFWGGWYETHSNSRSPRAG